MSDRPTTFTELLDWVCEERWKAIGSLGVSTTRETISHWEHQVSMWDALELHLLAERKGRAA
jgi:hypothetical protein